MLGKTGKVGQGNTTSSWLEDVTLAFGTYNSTAGNVLVSKCPNKPKSHKEHKFLKFSKAFVTKTCALLSSSGNCSRLFTLGSFLIYGLGKWIII